MDSPAPPSIVILARFRPSLFPSGGPYVSVFDDATKCCATAVSPAYKQVAPLFCSISQSQPNPSFFRAAQPGDFPRIVQVLNRVNVNGRDISVIPQESPTHAFLGELISTLALSVRPRLFLNCCFRWWRRDAGGNLCAQKHILLGHAAEPWSCNN